MSRHWVQIPSDTVIWAANSVVPGEELSGVPNTSLPGQGVVQVDESFVASAVGIMKRVGKIVSVQPSCLHIYEPVTADVVLGRVVRLLPNKWVLDIGAIQHATLHIDNLNIPGIQRVRDTADESNMRQWLDVDQLISCEIKQGYALLTRSAQFGVLNHGILVKVPPCAVGPSTTAFANLDPLNVHVILGRNGWIWLSEMRDPSDTRETIRDSASPTPSKEQLQAISYVAQLLQTMCAAGERITPASIISASKRSRSDAFPKLSTVNSL
ncbi:RRP4-related protein [Giardia lamblia P15]|uniref:RRP4-related protein n=1 Tax=Giardia intestinalis (strain P15) TaxID=658858 RepID=E1EZF9_GIAIA|nr:RRP4-related protein [Giardia lamblia P15]